MLDHAVLRRLLHLWVAPLLSLQASMAETERANSCDANFDCVSLMQRTSAWTRREHQIPPGAINSAWSLKDVALPAGIDMSPLNDILKSVVTDNHVLQTIKDAATAGRSDDPKNITIVVSVPTAYPPGYLPAAIPAAAGGTPAAGVQSTTLNAQPLTSTTTKPRSSRTTTTTTHATTKKPTTKPPTRKSSQKPATHTLDSELRPKTTSKRPETTTQPNLSIRPETTAMSQLSSISPKTTTTPRTRSKSTTKAPTTKQTKSQIEERIAEDLNTLNFELEQMKAKVNDAQSQLAREQKLVEENGNQQHAIGQPEETQVSQGGIAKGFANGTANTEAEIEQRVAAAVKKGVEQGVQEGLQSFYIKK